MRHPHPLRALPVVLGALIGLSLLAACAPQEGAAVDIDALLGGQQAEPAEPAAEAPARPTPRETPRAEAAAHIDQNCVNCHSNEEFLMAMAAPTEPKASLWAGESWQPTLEFWERILVDEQAVETGVHAFISCTDCHGGNDVETMHTAHQGLIVDPSAGPENVCGDCHTDIQASYSGSLHNTLAGFSTALYERSVPENHPALDEAQADNCSSCHTTCGQCHISQPTSVGGGLLEGHQYVQVPPTEQTCAACHGSRVNDEYTGMNDGVAPDVHYAGGMTCINCHTGDEMHGKNVNATHLYDGTRTPKCESCHQAALVPGAGIEEHTIHGQDVACQVCHAVDYENYSGLQVGATEAGQPPVEIAESWLELRIGQNPHRTPERPWQYVLVRHVPIQPDSFAAYGENLLPNFDDRPTWVQTTPHNIQRNTMQAARCLDCHGNPDIFLTEDAVAPEELEANRAVIASPPSLDLLGPAAGEQPAEEATPEG